MPKFTPFRKIADYDYGVKGFEIRFQEMIEEYLEQSGIDAPWWRYYNGSIFEEVWEIYKIEEKEQDHEILCNLHDYYTKVTKEVARRVKDKALVTHEERKERLQKEKDAAEEANYAQDYV